MEIKKMSLILMILSTTTFGQNKDFKNRPWKSDYPIILDVYGLNNINFNLLKREKQVKAIIFKASDGLNADSKYSNFKKEAISNGYLVASYHLGRKGNPIEQAEFYLTQIGNAKNELMAIDIEKLDGNNISLSDAEIFINHIYKKTGKFPMVYVNNEVFEAINKNYGRESSFAKCELWYARFKEVLPQLSTKVWDKVTLWQFACEINCQIKETRKDNPSCPIRIAGTANDMDVNIFNGNEVDLKHFWLK